MEASRNNKRSIIFYSVWILLGLWQAYNTEFLPDEALYWKFSEQLALGYFDQPPLVAYILKIGDGVYHHPLGARLFFVFLSAATIWLLEKLIQPNETKLVYSIILATAILHFESFFAIPDVPLLFFVALYFLLLKKFYQKPNVKIAAAIGVCVGLMGLAKYHGILVIIFTIVANPKILKSKFFWQASVVAAIIFLPHIVWLWKNDFVTIEYHLLQRSDNSFEFKNVINYLLSALVFFGPFIGFLFYWSVYKFRAKDVFGRTLKVTVYGSLLFFLFLSFKGNVEANWLLLLSVPLIYIGYHSFEKNENLRRWHKKLFIPGLVLIFMARVFLAYNILPNASFLKPFNDKFHTSVNFVKRLKEKAWNKEVVFLNSYRRASIYHFYSGIPAISRRSYWSRKTQFDLWNSEEKWRGKEVIIVPDYYEPTFDSVMINNHAVSYLKVLNFQPSKGLLIKAENIPANANPNQELTVPISLSFSNLRDKKMDVHEIALFYCFEDGTGKYYQSKELKYVPQSQFANEIFIDVKFPKRDGVYKLFFGAQTNWVAPTLNSKAYSIKID